MLSVFNPWISMWTEPKSTIRAIVLRNPNFGVVYLVSIYTLQNFFYVFSFFHIKFPVYLTLGVSLLLSPILGMVWLYFFGAVFYLIGRCLKGSAPMKYILTAIAWSKIPMSISLLMWFVLFAANQGIDLLYSLSNIEWVFIGTIASILMIWSQVLLFQSIREIQKFSVVKTLSNMVLSWISFNLILYFIYFLIF